MKHFAESRLEKLEPALRELAVSMLEEPDNDAYKNAYYLAFTEQENEQSRKTLEKIEEVITAFRPGCGDREAYRTDILASSILYGASPEEYFQFEFDQKTDKGRSEYLCGQERFEMFRPFYDFSQYEKVRNKWLQYQELKDLFGRECVACREEEDEEAYKAFESFAAKHPAFLWKPVRSSCGEGVRVIRIQGGNRPVRELYRDLCKRSGIADELIIQDERMGVFHPSSVNTVRLIALRDLRGRNYATQALLRIGKSGSLVDNTMAAIRARIDEETGIVITPGFDGYGSRYVLHPDGGRQIVGFQIPEWEGLLETAGRAMERMRGYARYIGFDLALTKGHWILVEVNPFPQIYMQQIATRKGNRRELRSLCEACM